MDSPALVKRKLYGREDYYAVYSAARGIIIRHKLLRIKQFELTCDGTRRLTICNLWRMERTTDDTLHHVRVISSSKAFCFFFASRTVDAGVWSESRILEDLALLLRNLFWDS